MHLADSEGQGEAERNCPSRSSLAALMEVCCN